MVHRGLAVLLAVAFVAGGCSGSEPSGSSDADGTSVPSASSEPPADSPAMELGAWHALVAGPDGLLLANGYPETATDPGPLEMWEQTSEGWSLVPVTGDRPSGRNFAGVAVDTDTGEVVLHGGLTDEGVSDETWVWAGDAWTRVARGAAGPGPRSSPAMASDDSAGVILLYGGDDGADQYSDTWAFTDDTWEQVAAAGPEPVRWPATMATDPRGGVVLFGGHQVIDEGAPPAVGDTWVWRRGRWREVAGADEPGPLVNAGSVVHPEHGLLLVGGGDDRGRQRGRVWRWSGSAWDLLSSDLFPPREAFGLGYDPAREVVVLTGGLVEPGSTDRLQDTWEWSGDLGAPATPTG